MPTPLLSLFSVGLTTGLVIESGDGLTWIVPIINGSIVQHAVQKLPLAGIDVNQNLKSLLMREGVSIASSAADEIIQEAEKKARKIVEDAQTEAERIVHEAKQKEAQSVQTGNDALAQAARDLAASTTARRPTSWWSPAAR